MAVFERRLSGEAGLSGLLFNTAYDKYETGNHRKLYMGCCYIGIRGRREVPKWYRVFSCLFALAVFISTLTTKQHVIIDVIAGAALAEAAYRVAGCTGFDSYYGRIAGKVNRRIFKGQLL